MNEQQTKQTLPRMRTLAKAIEEIKAEDPNTALTQNQLRVLVKSGAIPSVHAGRHTLINLDLLIAYIHPRAGLSTHSIPHPLALVKRKGR